MIEEKSTNYADSSYTDKKRKSSCSNIFDRFKRVFAEAAFNKTKKNISPKKYYQNTLS